MNFKFNRKPLKEGDYYRDNGFHRVEWGFMDEYDKSLIKDWLVSKHPEVIDDCIAYYGVHNFDDISNYNVWSWVSDTGNESLYDDFKRFLKHRNYNESLKEGYDIIKKYEYDGQTYALMRDDFKGTYFGALIDNKGNVNGSIVPFESLKDAEKYFEVATETDESLKEGKEKINQERAYEFCVKQAEAHEHWEVIDFLRYGDEFVRSESDVPKKVNGKKVEYMFSSFTPFGSIGFWLPGGKRSNFEHAYVVMPREWSDDANESLKEGIEDTNITKVLPASEYKQKLLGELEKRLGYAPNDSVFSTISEWNEYHKEYGWTPRQYAEWAEPEEELREYVRELIYAYEDILGHWNDIMVESLKEGYDYFETDEAIYHISNGKHLMHLKAWDNYPSFKYHDAEISLRDYTNAYRRYSNHHTNESLKEDISDYEIDKVYKKLSKLNKVDFGALEDEFLRTRPSLKDAVYKFYGTILNTKSYCKDFVKWAKEEKGIDLKGLPCKESYRRR